MECFSNVNFRSYIKNLFRLPVVLLLLLALSNCKDVESLNQQLQKLTSHTGEYPLVGLRSKTGWENLGADAIIQAGDFRDKGLWNDPCVLREKNQYVMYMASSVGEPFKPPIIPFRAVSNDGKNWTLDPKEPVAQPLGTPFVSVETPNVVKFNDMYHMYFTGIYPIGGKTPMAIGHAVSKDGIKWKVDPNPVLKSVSNIHAWNGFLVAEPGAVVYKNQIYVYFTAMGARPGGNPPQLQTIGLAITKDGMNFDEPRMVVKQAPIYPPEKGFVGYSTPTAFLHEGSVHLVFDLAHFEKERNPEWQQIGLHHAVSSDGETNFIQDENPLMTRKDYVWTSGEMLGPSVIIDEGKVKLWFSGHVSYSELAPLINRGFRGKEFGIGYVSMNINKFINIGK